MQSSLGASGDLTKQVKSILGLVREVGGYLLRKEGQSRQKEHHGKGKGQKRMSCLPESAYFL